MATSKKAKGKKVAGRAPSGAKAAAGAAKAAASSGWSGNGGPLLAELSAFDEMGTEEIGGASMGWEDRRLLGRVARFLTTVVAPRFLRRAGRAGYSKGEHEELWGLFLRAAGRDQPLAYAFAAADVDSDGERAVLFGEVDAFENEWFPKARAIIERRVPAGSAERFLAAFFKDLVQQPLGPLVLDSVATFLDRVEALAASAEPGAAEVLRNLRARGLSADKVAEMRARIARARSGAPAPQTNVSADEIRRAYENQTEALRLLRLAWNDWSTTLRPLYDAREGVQLGLVEVKVRASGEQAEPGGAAPPPPAGPTPPSA